jgi:tetratricopeptide (TPR) repeat protein
VAVDLVGAVVGWLTAEAATRAVGGGRRLILGDAQRRALRRVVRRAVADTVAGAGLSKPEAAQLRTALLAASGPVRRIEAATATELRAVVVEWVRPLAAEGVDRGGLSDELVIRILRGIEADARSGGPLGHVAEWLWRDDTTRLLAAIDGRFMAWEPSGAGPGGRGGLPGVIPDFTGRAAALADLRTRLAGHNPDGRFTAIYAVNGMGGVGKTTLAIQAAWEVAERYPDGGFFIDLHGFTAGIAPLSPEAALEQLLRDAGLSAGAIPPGVAARQARWRSLMANRKAIVVLDNAVDSAQIRPLLPGGPGCLVIVTSRRRLTALPEAEEVFLDVLSPGEAEQLFLRVGGVHCGNGPDTEDRDDVRQVVRLCGYLPLAVRIVAARLRGQRTVPLRALVSELNQTSRLAELSPEGAGVAGALHLSMARLDAAQVRAVHLLGLHPGPCYRPRALAHLADIGEVEAKDLLRALAEHHLVAPVAGTGVEFGYECHDLVRDFARAQALRHLDQTAQEAARGRLSRWYRRVVDENGPDLLAAERDNLVAFCIGSGTNDAISIGLDAAGKLSVLGFYEHARRLYAHGHGVSRASADRVDQARAAFGLADLARLTFGELGHALEYYQEARDQYAAVGDEAGETTAVLGIAHIARITGDNHSALRRYQQAADTFARSGDLRGHAYATWGLAAIHARLGDLDRAQALFEHALTLDIRLGYEFGQAEDQRGLGKVAFQAGDLGSARARFQNAYELSCKIGYRRGQAHNLLGLGQVARATGDAETARRLFTEAIAIYDELGLALAVKARAELAAVDDRRRNG